MKAMPDDSRLAIRLLTLGVALLTFGLGCHFWADRTYRTAGLAIVSLFPRQTNPGPCTGTEDGEADGWMRSCDHLTAVLLVTTVMHVLASAST